MSEAPAVSLQGDRVATGNPIVRMRGIVKRFGGAVALDGVDFDLRPGEIHALLGENGAGKSTLIKVLAGVHQRDDGELHVGGRELANHFAPADIRSAGLGFVHQDLGLIDSFTVAENIALGHGYPKRKGLIDFAAAERSARELLATVAVEVEPTALVGDLSQDEKVMVAVARAFALDARGIVLDEVSSSLPAPEVARLADALRRSKQSGVGYVYVTHRLDELYGFADRVTVLRDGRCVATADMESVSADQIVDWIVGGRETPRRVESRAAASAAAPTLVVDGLAGPGLGAPVSFSAAPGEVIGICGLVGSGARDLAALLGGGAAPTAGTVALDGEPLPVGDPVALRRAGCNYVPGDRQREGGIGALTIRENFFLRAATGEDDDRAVLRPGRERGRARELLERYRVKPAGEAERSLDTLSGGNQQKVVCGRALRTAPRLLVVDDPTAGVDVGARADLHALIRECAASGAVVVLASTDFDEVAAEADRALVMASGSVVGLLSREEISSDALARASYGSDNDQEQDS